MKDVLLVAVSFLLTYMTQGAPPRAAHKSEIILSIPLTPMDESRIQQALNRLKEELARPTISSEDSGFDGEDLTLQQIKFLMQNGNKSLPAASIKANAQTPDVILDNREKKTETSEHYGQSRAKEIPPMSYLKESIGDDDHEFFFEEPRRNTFSASSFRDVLDEAEEKDEDDEDDDEGDSSDDIPFRSNDHIKSGTKNVDKVSRAENEAGYFVEPDTVVAEHANKCNENEELIPEKDVVNNVNGDDDNGDNDNGDNDELLRATDVEKHSEEEAFEPPASEVIAHLDSGHNITTNASDFAAIKFVSVESSPALLSESTTASTLTYTALSSQPAEASMATETSSPAASSPEVWESTSNNPLMNFSAARITDLENINFFKKNNISTDFESGMPTQATVAPLQTTTTNTGSSSISTPKPMGTVTEKQIPVEITTSKPTTAASSTVQKIPQFIKSIYEAATQKLPSFIHAQGVDAGLITPPKQSQNPASTTSAPAASVSGDSQSEPVQVSSDKDNKPQVDQVADGNSTQGPDESSHSHRPGSMGLSGNDSEAVSVNRTSLSASQNSTRPTSPEPIQEVQYTTSSPQDTPMGILVKGTACEGQTMSKLDKVIERFPTRLPELHEFKRRRFLRAAVIGGLHTLRSTQRNVTCNLTSRTTYWGYKLSGQLDGILNLGITGLPRMYLRYSGPLTVKVTMSAMDDEIRPVVDQVTVEESKVDEIHYQSVLGFEQPFVERATRYLLQRAMKEEIVDPIKNAILDELQNPKPDKSKVLLLDDLKNLTKY